MEHQSLTLPLGYKFIPKPSELLIHYLLNKILGQSVPADIIPTFDCFSCSPDQLPFELFKYGRANEWYFYTNRRSENIVITGDGYYEFVEENKEYDGDKLIGFVRIFEFYYSQSESDQEVEWSIMEYRVNPQLWNGNQISSTMDSNLAVCKVIKYVEVITPTETFVNTTLNDHDDS